MICAWNWLGGVLLDCARAKNFAAWICSCAHSCMPGLFTIYSHSICALEHILSPAWFSVEVSCSIHHKKFLFRIFILTWKCITTFAINKTQFLPCEKHYSLSMVIEWWYLDDGNTRIGKCTEKLQKWCQGFLKEQCLIAMQMSLENLVHLYQKKKKIEDKQAELKEK